VIVRKPRPDQGVNDFAINECFDEICVFHRSPPPSDILGCEKPSRS
jgi:hypothetical protein